MGQPDSQTLISMFSERVATDPRRPALRFKTCGQYRVVSWSELETDVRRAAVTLGGNVATLALDSKFDNCQALVKQAFSDPDLADLGLTSANSINIGRLLPQSVYYIYAASRLADAAGGEKVIFSVPSGNFGDLMGGLLAYHMGLPVERFIVATTLYRPTVSA